jgi:hypothetical protein
LLLGFFFANGVCILTIVIIVILFKPI